MAKFPRLSSADIIDLLQRNGFQAVRQKGSHLTLFQVASGKHVTVPVGRKDLPIGTAKAILRAAGIDM